MSDIDLLGPGAAGAARSLAAGALPSGEISSPDATDTFFMDCVANTPGTGTPVVSTWLNRLMQQIRRFIRVSGVGLNNLDDDMLGKAVQSGAVNWAGVFGGGVNAYTATLSPAPGALLPGTIVRGAIPAGGTNTGASTLTVNGLGAVPIVNSDGSALNAGDLGAGNVASFLFTGASFVYSQSSWRNAIRAQVDNWTLDSGAAANTLNLTLPAGATLTTGMPLRIKKGNLANTGAMTAVITAGTTTFSPVTLVWTDGSAFAAGDFPANAVGQAIFDGTVLRMNGMTGPSIFQRASSAVTNGVGPYYGTDTGSADNIQVSNLNPSISAYAAGQLFVIGVAHSNATTTPKMQIGALGQLTITRPDGTACKANDLQAGTDALLVCTGSGFQLMALPPGAFVQAATSAASVSATYALATNQSVARSAYTTVGVSGSNPSFCTSTGGVLTVTAAGIYIMTGTMVTTSTQSSGETEYCVAYIYKNGSQITSSQSNNYSYGSSSLGISISTATYLNAGDTVNLEVFMHSSSNDDTADTIVAGGATIFSIVKVG